MKTFVEFILICEKLNKTFDEDAHAKVWNYFISNPEYTEVRDALKSGNKDKALELMKAELERAKGDSDHPLNFTKADDSEFSMTGEGKNKRVNREDSDREQFDAEIEKAIGGVTSLATQKKFKDAVEKGFPARKTGASKAELSKTWSGAGGKNTTPKADLEVYNPDNEKNRRGISLKKAGGSQIASAEAGELRGTYKAASKSFVQRFYGDKSREERKRIEREINDDIRRVADINDQARTANNDEKEQLKNSGQEILDKIHDKYPNLTRLVTQVSTTGDEKFRGRNAPGSAGTIVTGDKAKPAEEQPSARPRNAKPKDSGRPGNVKIDNKEAPKKSNQAQPQQGPKTFKQFDREARTAELRSKGVGSERDERIAAEKEAIKQEKNERRAAARQAKYDTRKAQQALAAAEAEKQSAQNELETNPDGTKTYRQHQAQKRINNPNLNARLTTADQAVQTANMTFADIQAKAAQAKEILAAQSQQQKPEVQQQRTEPVDTKPQQPTTEPSQPQQPQPTQTPPSTQPQQTQTPPPEQQQQQPPLKQKPEPKKKLPNQERNKVYEVYSRV
jgi:hypothetical protein